MHNLNLTQDYLKRACARLKALQVLFDNHSYADVVREAQEIIELCLKAVLRQSNIEPPRTHDVSQVLLDHQEQLPQTIQNHVKKLSKISKSLRRDRELAYYGSEDLTPSDFYQEEDGKDALESAQFTYEVCKTIL